MNLSFIKQNLKNIVTTPLNLAKRKDVQDTLKVWWFGISKVPLLFAMRPRVKQIDEEQAKILLKLSRTNKNHVGSMYMGAIMGGADLACGLLTLHLLEKRNLKAAPIFKTAEAKFLKRIEADAMFICDSGDQINKMIDDAEESKLRQNLKVRVNVFVPSKLGEEVAATVDMTVSIKIKS